MDRSFLRVLLGLTDVAGLVLALLVAQLLLLWRAVWGGPTPLLVGAGVVSLTVPLPLALLLWRRRQLAAGKSRRPVTATSIRTAGTVGPVLAFVVGAVALSMALLFALGPGAAAGWLQWVVVVIGLLVAGAAVVLGLRLRRDFAAVRDRLPEDPTIPLG